MAQSIVARTTAQAISETRLIRDVDDEMAERFPNTAPFLTFLNKMSKWAPCDSPRVEWFEKDRLATWDVNSAYTVAANASSTTVTVTDGTKWVAGDLGLVPQAKSSATAPEMFRVTVVASNVLTVVRNVGGAGLVSIDAGCALMILGKAYEENATLPGTKIVIPTAKISYTEIMRFPLSISSTQLASKTYASGGSDREQMQEDKLEEAKIFCNRQFLFGRASEDLTGGPNGNPIRTTMGLDSVISTNKVTGGGLLTKKLFEEFARAAFNSGSSEKVLLMSPLVTSAIQQWGNSYLQLKPMEKVFGVDLQRWKSGHGTWFLVPDRNLEDGVADLNGFGGCAYSIDMKDIYPIFLRGCNFKLHEGILQTGVLGETDEVWGEVGLKIKNETHHAKLYNVTDYES